MVIGIARIKLIAPWVRSLKEKRMVVRSIIGKVRSRFNVAINEVEELDTHQTIIIGLSQVSNNRVVVESMINQVIDYIEGNTEANISDIEVEIINF
ncbi:MAG: DUF503 domain-containing protein [Cellulosilyticaceae bacterium]